jgi:magnesium-transporting ATPase (P-type)
MQTDNGAEPMSPDMASGLRACIHNARIHNRKTIALARRVSPYPDLSMPAAVQSNMTLIGCITVDDPIGADVPGWVSWCRESSIRLVIFCEDLLRARQSLDNAGVIGASDTACVYNPERLTDALTAESGGNLLIQISPSDHASALDTLRKLSKAVYVSDRLSDLPCIKPGDSIVVDRNDGNRMASGSRRADAVIYREQLDRQAEISDASNVFQMISYCKNALYNIRCAVLYLLTTQVFRGILIAMTLLTDLPILAPGTILLFGCVVDFLAVMLISFRKPKDAPSPMPVENVCLPGWKDGLLAALGIGVLSGLLVTFVTFLLWRFSWVFDRNAIMHLGLISVLCLSAVTLHTSVSGKFTGRKKSRASAVYIAYVVTVLLILALLLFVCISRYAVTDAHVWLLTLLPSCIAFLMQRLYQKS